MENGNFTSKDGLQISFYELKPLGEPRGVILLVHGMGDHARALPYRIASERFSAQEYVVFGFDLRGHGASEGERMYVSRFSDYTDDLGIMKAKIAGAYPALPLFLCGVSMGGLIAIHFLLLHPNQFQGMIAVSPALDNSGASAFLRTAVPLMASVLPHIKINLKLDLTKISRNHEAVSAYTDDPNFQTRSSLNLAAELIKAIRYAQENATRLSLPFLLLQGGKDGIVPPAGAQLFYQRITSKIKHNVCYPDAMHNLFIELNNREILQDSCAWLARF